MPLFVVLNFPEDADDPRAAPEAGRGRRKCRTWTGSRRAPTPQARTRQANGTQLIGPQPIAAAPGSARYDLRIGRAEM
ncbi:hypothetical protein GCM10009548_54630 [Streptomyces malaysiensis subsp. malaysiensis]